jgi:alanine dehydrogenase
MPGAVALTSTIALTNQTLHFGLQLADLGVAQAVKSNKALRGGLNLYKGYVTNEPVAQSLGLPFKAITDALVDGQ